MALTSQEIKLSKLDLALYLGQALKAVVLTPLNDGEVTININGQNINAKTSHQFTPGETLDVKVVNTDDEIVLQVQQQPQNAPALQKTILQNALMQNLPKQAPPTNLLENLEQLVQSSQVGQTDKLPPAIMQQIKTLLANIPAIAQLPQQLSKAINQSGVFLESTLLQWQPGMPTAPVQTDFKAQYLKLLNSLPIELKNNFLMSIKNETQDNANPTLQRDPLPLPGAIPQPLHKDAILNLSDKTPETIQTVIHEQVNQALSRITANQVTHLTQMAQQDDNKSGFLIMLDIPVKTPQNDIDVIPLMIKQRKATATEPSQWSMSFAVSLSELGDLQGTVTLNGTEVSVKINTDKQETIDTLNHYQGDMQDLLKELGLNLGGFNLKLGLENNKIQTENLHLLDIRI
ncbi:flagellar hook-length control protein FliK [Legionella sp. km772]|nr:flagellar hook-length control protein FliK [Legionella sp. km772]RUR13570.1 flagellar hook-length control protein FliK [Legionella sp. km772]